MPRSGLARSYKNSPETLSPWILGFWPPPWFSTASNSTFPAPAVPMRDWLSLIPKRFCFDPLLSTHSQATFASSRSPVTCMLIVPKSTLLLQSESQLIMLKNPPHGFPQSFREWEKQVVGAGVERQRGKGVVRGESKGRGGKRKGRAAQTNILQSKQSGEKGTLFLKQQIPSPCLLVFQSITLLLTKPLNHILEIPLHFLFFFLVKFLLFSFGSEAALT